MRRIAFVPVMLVFTWFAGTAWAQQNQPPLPQPRLATVFPPGGKAGTTIEVTFSGTDVEEPQALLFSHAGIKAEPIIPPLPPPPKVDPKKKPAKPPEPPKPLPITKFKVTIAADAPLGLHDVRLVNKWGVSNPRPFSVGTLNEADEKEPNNDVAQTQKVEINSVVNGVVNSPTDVDYYMFSGKKGQRVLLNVAATSIDSRAKPALEVYNAAGDRILFTRNYRDYDALGDATLPADGEYWIRLFNFTHTIGGSEHYYRLTLTTGPWIDAVVPPMVEPGKTTPVTVYGRNLPGGQLDPTANLDGRPLEKLSVSITAPSDPAAQQRVEFSGRRDPLVSSLDGFEYRFRGPNGVSNPYLITFARGPVAAENEANDKPESAPALTLPCEIAGRLEKRGDRDWYLLTVKKGDVFTIELFADRLGSAGDFFYMLKQADPKAGAMTEQEDTNDSLHPFQFFTRTFDPQPYRFEAQQDGKYWLMVSSRDVGTTFGPQSIYRLRITPPQPDFRLIVMPSSDNRPDAAVLRTGGEQLYDVFAWRQDGFVGPITVTVEGLPAGVTCTPQSFGATQKQAAFVLSAAANAAVATSAITVKGTAVVNGKTVVREARPATISWQTQQANAPTLSRLDRQLVLAVREKAPFRLTPEVQQIAVKQGDKAQIKLKLARLWPELKAVVNVQAVTITGNQPLVPGIVFNNNQPLAIAADKTEGTGTLTIAQNVAPGTYTFVLRGAAQFQYGKTPKDKKQNVGLVQPATPIMLTVVPRSLGKVSASLPNPNLKQGMTGELLVKVERQHSFAGEYKIKAVLPPNTQGVSVAEGVIAPGQVEVKLPVTIAKDAKPVNLQNIVVQSVALFDPKTPITDETKFSGLNIVPLAVGKFTASATKPIVKQGETGEVVVKVERQYGFNGEFKLKVVLPPNTQGVSIGDASIPQGRADIKLPVKVAKDAKPIVLQNVVIQAVAQFNPNIPIAHETMFGGLSIVPTSLAKLSVAPTKPNLKAGEQGELLVKVERLYGFSGEYKVKVVMPPNVKGVTIGEGVVPAGKNEVKLPVTVAKDAKPINLQNVVVQSVAQFDPKTPVMDETKFSGLNVVK